MEIKTHQLNDRKVSELISEDLVITNIDDGTDLVGSLYYSGADRVIIHERNIIPAFFDLKNKMAGEILQKFSNYRIRLAIVGEFSGTLSESLKSFIYESNRGKQVSFVASLDQAIQKLVV